MMLDAGTSLEPDSRGLGTPVFFALSRWRQSLTGVCVA